MVDSSNKTLKSLAPYLKFFDFSKLTYKDPIVLQYASVFDTLRNIRKVVSSTLDDTRKIAAHLKDRSLEETLRRNWHFVHDHIGYEIDQKGVEQIRRPLRLVKDKKGDCDCFSTFLSSLLTNQGIEHSLRMTKYSGDWQHVYVIVPKQGKKGYYTLDCVLHQFDKEEPFTQKFDQKMQLQVLNGVPSSSPGMGFLGAINLLGFGEEFTELEGLGVPSPQTADEISLDFLARIKRILFNTRKELENNPDSVENPEELAKQLDYALENFNNAEAREEALAKLEEMELELEENDEENSIEGLGRRRRFRSFRRASRFFNKKNLTKRLNPVSRVKRHLRKLNPRKRFQKHFSKKRFNPRNKFRRLKRVVKRKSGKRIRMNRMSRGIRNKLIQKRNERKNRLMAKRKRFRSSIQARKNRTRTMFRQRKCQCGVKGLDEMEDDLDLEGLGRRRRRRRRRGGFWKRIRKATKKVGKSMKKGLKKFGKTKVGKFLKKVGKAIVKYNPLTITIRNAFYLALRFNIFNIAGRLYYGTLSESEARAKNMNMSEFKKAQRVSKRARNLIVNKFQGKGSVYDKSLKKGIERAKRKGKINGLGEPATAASVTAASGVLATIGAWLKKINFKKLFNAVKKVKNILPKKKGSSTPPNTMMRSGIEPRSSNPYASSGRNNNITSNDLPQDKKSNMGLMIGAGVAVLGIGAAIMMSKKKSSGLSGTRRKTTTKRNTTRKTRTTKQPTKRRTTLKI